jgi:hypothetical protein
MLRNVLLYLAVACGLACHGADPADSRPQPRQPAPPAAAPTIPSPPVVPSLIVTAPSAVGCVRVGGAIRAPHKVRDRHAELSEAARRTSTHGGVLIYDATIDESGQVRNLRLASPVDPAAPWPEMEKAWRTAIGEWQYEPTLVNGHASRVCMTISVTIDVR